MANNSCRFKWTHCNTLPIYRAERQWQATKRSTQAWQALCIRICQLQDTALWNISSYSKALEPQAVSRLSQGSEHRGPHPAPTTSLSTRRIIFQHCGWQVFPIRVSKSSVSRTGHFLETQSIIWCSEQKARWCRKVGWTQTCCRDH